MLAPASVRLRACAAGAGISRSDPCTAVCWRGVARTLTLGLPCWSLSRCSAPLCAPFSINISLSHTHAQDAGLRFARVPAHFNTRSERSGLTAPVDWTCDVLPLTHAAESWSTRVEMSLGPLYGVPRVRFLMYVIVLSIMNNFCTVVRITGGQSVMLVMLRPHLMLC